MSLPIASLPQEVAPHTWEHRVILMGGHSLYISKTPTRDKCVQDYDPPLFAVGFDEQDSYMLEDVTHSVVSILNVGPARQRQELLGKRELIHSRGLYDVVKAGSIFAHRPTTGRRLQLCFVPCAAGLNCLTAVLPLQDLRHTWIIEEIC